MLMLMVAVAVAVTVTVMLAATVKVWVMMSAREQQLLVEGMKWSVLVTDSDFPCPFLP